jgi:hypothetical protein
METQDKETYINYVILGIVSVCAADIQPVAIVHRLHDSYVIPAVEELEKGELKMQIKFPCQPPSTFNSPGSCPWTGSC